MELPKTGNRCGTVSNVKFAPLRLRCVALIAARLCAASWGVWAVSAFAENASFKLSLQAAPRLVEWREPVRYAINEPFELAAVADLDGDGRAEVIITRPDSTLVALRPQPDGAYRSIVLGPFPTPLFTSRLRLQREPSELFVGAFNEGVRGFRFVISGDALAGREYWRSDYPASEKYRADRVLDWRCSHDYTASHMAVFQHPGGGASHFCVNSRAIEPVAHDLVFLVEPPAQTVLAGDLDGDGVDEVLIRNGDESTLADSRFPVRTWSYFPPDVQWLSFTGGDFDDDLRTDVLTTGEPFGSSMVAFSRGSYALELSARWPFPPTVDRSSLRAGDIDGDGRDDLIAIESIEEKRCLTVALTRPAPERSGSRRLVVLTGGAPPLPTPWGVWQLLTSLERFERIQISGSTRIDGVEAGLTQLFLLDDRGGVEWRAFHAWKSRPRAITLVAQADEASGSVGDYFGVRHQPAVCLGYAPKGRLDAVTKWGMGWVKCPPGFVFYGVPEGAHSAETSSLLGVCCPLPAGDILLPQTATTYRQCPDGFVVTGGFGKDQSCPQCPVSIECTKINTDRYMLAPARPCRYWGDGKSGARQSERLQRFDIPLALREGITRESYLGWAVDGCIGTPIGSLLTAKGGRRCYESEYRELLYRGLAGDPPKGTPVKMFPNCAELDDPFDPSSGCRVTDP